MEINQRKNRKDLARAGTCFTGRATPSVIPDRPSARRRGRVNASRAALLGPRLTVGVAQRHAIFHASLGQARSH